MPTFEPLRPRVDGFADPFDDEQEQTTFSPLAPQARPAVRQPVVGDVEHADPFSPLTGDLGLLGSPDSEFSEPKEQANPSFRSGALHRIGVKWAEGTSDEARPFQATVGFYDLDYDPRGERGAKLGKGTSYVEAANVFGRQFTRAELDKDEEGRKLVKLMEAQRTGAYQEEGFWKGAFDFNLGNVPWLGWMMDMGSTVSESISISKAMRKMQDGEPVTNREAIAVRRFMLQQELESRRSTSYQIGSTIRSSVPFVVEVAGASAMTAMAAKAGMMVGGAIGTLLGPGIGTGIGAAVGGAIGAVGGFVFGGGRLLSKLLTKGVKGAVRKLAAKSVANPMMEGLAGRLFTEGYKKAERSAAVDFAAKATGKSVREVAQAAREVGKTRAYESVGRELAEKNLGAEAVKDWTSQQFSAYATQNAAKSELRRRTSFEATRWTAESFKDVADLTMDARLAKIFLVNGDAANMVEQGWVQSLERAALAKVYGTVPDRAKDGFWKGFANYWADRAAVRKGLDKLTGEEINNLKASYLTATMNKALGRPSAVTAVTGSISESLGGQAVSRGYASDVAEHLVNNATRSFMLKYKGTGFVNGAQRVARWVGDGILDGMLRWDTSIYHGAGTIMRSGTVLGGKMAAFKEALKASFVEAPVRGAMQFGMQVPLWPVVSAATGNGPGDFVVRGQLGIQSTALQTGDREMMDHARAIAIGSGLVEYISESSGRGFNILAEGVAAPTLKNAPFLAATREVGSYMSRKLEAVFGTKKMMEAANRTRLTQAVADYLGKRSARLVETGGASAALPTMSKTQVGQIVAGAKGVGNIKEVLSRLGLKSEKDLVKAAMVDQLKLTKMRAGLTYFVAHNMLEKGWTPQKMASWLQRVGYDGVLAEMAEERYGGFFQGLMGLDDSPSDSTARDRWAAAMHGLLPDPHQLLVEAVSFSFPAVTQLTMNSLYSRLGAGVVSETLDDAKLIAENQNTEPTVTLTAGSEGAAKALSDYNAGAQALYEKATVGEGGEEKAWADVLGHPESRPGRAVEVDGEVVEDTRAPTRAQAVKAALADKSFVPNDKNKDISDAKISDGEMETLLREKAQRIIDLSNTEADLEKQLADHQAEALFGKEGVEAIKRLKRKDPGYMDAAKRKALADGSEYAEFVRRGPDLKLTDDADAGTVASEITAALPFVSNDAALTAEVRERLSVREGVQVNQFSSDYAGETAEAMGRLGKKWLDFKYKLGQSHWWGRRALMRVTGILDAITTGRLELAARNPVQWAIEEAQLPRQLMGEVGQLYERSVQAGRDRYLQRMVGDGKMTAEDAEALRRRSLGDVSGDILEEFKKEGEEEYRTTLREYAQTFLAARNVLAVSKGDVNEAALRVVAHKHREESGGKVVYRFGTETTEDFRDEKFRAAVAGKEMAAAKAEIVKGLARIAASDAVAMNTHSRFGNVNTTSIAFSYDRAMRYGNTPEVVAAIRAMPAFRNMRAVYDVSNGGHVKDAALARTVDVGELLRLDPSGQLAPGDLRRVMFAMGRYYGEFTEAQNQQAAAQYLTQLRLAVENSEPMAFEYADGTTAEVTTSYGRDKDGNRTVTLTANGVSVTGSTVLEATRMLEEVPVPKPDGTYSDVTQVGPDGVATVRRGVVARWREFAVLQNDSISSKDATSLVLLLHGTREKARAAYEAFYGVDREKGIEVDEFLYPPQLRRVDGDWQQDDDEATARALAAELAADDADTRRYVRGTGKEGDPFSVGYERAAELMLERFGITRSKQDAAATDTYRGEASYSIRPNGIAFGDTVYLQSDYYSGGDSEMMLRSAFSRAIYDAATKPGKAFDDPSAFVGILWEMDKAFTRAADEAIAELEESNPEMAQRVRDAMASLPSSPGRVNPSRMGAIAAAIAVFSDERGLNEYGNGFLFGPELAYVADRARRSPWVPLFISALDESLGGRGFFAEDAAGPDGTIRLDGLGRFLDAFAPSGPDLMASRASAMFTNGGEGARKTGIVFQWYGVPGDMSAAGLASGVPPVIDDTTVTNFTDVAERSVRLLVGAVGGKCKAFADAYRKAGGTISSAEMYRVLKHALDSGGDAGDEAPSIGSGFGGVSSETDKKVVRPQAADVVPDDVAFAAGRNLQFLSPGLMSAPPGGAGGRELALKSRFAVLRFLFERGCYKANADRIWSMFVDAAGAEEPAGAGNAEEREDDEEWASLAETISDGSGNQDIFFDAKRANAAIENKDLMDLGRQWSYVFPSEGGAFTQVLARMSAEIPRIVRSEREAADRLAAEAERLKGTDAPAKAIAELEAERSARLSRADALEPLAMLFNVFRSMREGMAAGRISDATGVWNDSSRVSAELKTTGAVLSRAVSALHAAGHDELAFVLNGVRNIPPTGKRRAQALALIGTMAPLDVNRVTVADYDGVGALETFGSAGLASVSSVRASVAHAMSRLFPSGSTSSQMSDTMSALDNLLLSTGSAKWFEKKKAGTPLRTKTIAELERILAPANEGAEIGAAFEKAPGDDKTLVAFANALVRRMAAVADALDYVIGPGNELAYALRSPDLLGGIVRSVRNAKDGAAMERVADDLLKLFRSCAASAELKSRCVLLSSAVLNPTIAAIQRATWTKGRTPTFSKEGEKKKQYDDIVSAGLSVGDLLGALSDDVIARLFARGNPQPQAAPRYQWFKNPMTGGAVSSYFDSVFKLYAASAPRSVERMSGTRQESIEDSSQVTATPASPPVMMMSIEDRLLAPLGVLDGYLQRGGRFEDGTRLVAVTAGARLENNRLVDKQHLSVIVANANISRFVRGDTRTGYFELYHGEKPTVYSVCLPHDVMQAVLDGIHAGADWAMNKVTRKMVEDGVLPRSVDDGTKLGTSADRDALYRAIYAVVASAARCDQIDPKRVQVLLAQGVPFSTYRDRMRKTVDGKVEEVDAAVTAMDGKTRVTPGLYCDILVSGNDAGENLGMYLNHGFLIESQRAQATNPRAVSFKNHVLGATFFKGQGHDFGLGMYETDPVPASGALAEACRVQRRRLEEVLGIKAGTLDLPAPDAPLSDEDKAYRESALKLVEAFFQSSTTFCTDMETVKTGSVSDKCGFFAKSGKPFTVKAGGKELTFGFEKDASGNVVRFDVRVDGETKSLLGGSHVVPAFKNSAASVTTMLPVIAKVLGKSELSAEDVGSIEAEWTLPTGEVTETKPLSESGLFQDYGTEDGDKLSVVASESGGFRVRYFTRTMSGQVMANSDASARPSLEHPAATNWTRDVVANSGRLRKMVPEQADFTWYATKAINVSRAVPYLLLRAQPGFFDELLKTDPDLYAAYRAHPNSQDVQERVVRRMNTVYAGAMKPYVNSMHAVLMGSGIKASEVTRNPDGTYSVKYSYSAGVTEYDKDCFRDARVLSAAEKAAFGVGRSYSSGQVNVLDPSFRYGWHLAENADLSEIRAAVDGSRKWSDAYRANLERLEQAYGPADEDMETVAYLAAYIEAFDRMRNRKVKAAMAKTLGAAFTDYTGKTLNENPSCDLMKVSFSDLFLGKRYGGDRFDLAAFEFRGDAQKKMDKNGARTIYLGGAFFAGDRRPSGNFESAGGLIRVQAPVLFDRASGQVDEHALYILPPLMNSSQGSDTDGDSTTGTVMSGKGLDRHDREILDQIHATIAARLKDAGADDLERFLGAEDTVNLLRTRFPQYFETETTEDGLEIVKPSRRFRELIGNVLLQEEIDNYRLMPNETQDEFGARDVNAMAGDRTIPDYGLAGRSPVGTKVVSGDVEMKSGGQAAALAAQVLGVDESEVAGEKYYDVFQRCIDKLSSHTMPTLDLLDPRVAAYLSGCAADANRARGVAVSLQAALEHLAGYADTDSYVRGLAPALYEERDGYRPIEDFIGHLDKISNALFDVVKDLFAPRAGWQAGLLNCLTARLLSDANEEYKAWRDAPKRSGTGPRWDDKWFFVKLVGFARDLHASDTTLPSLIAKANAFFDHSTRDTFLPGHERKTLLGMYNTMVLTKGGCIAKQAFKDVLLVKDGRLDIGEGQYGRYSKPVPSMPSLSKELSWFDAANDSMRPARGDMVPTCIDRLMKRIARALRMTEADFIDAEAREEAYNFGWRPASEIFGEETALAIADVLEGKNEGRPAGVDQATRVAVGLRFLSSADIGSALAAAKKDLSMFQALNDLLEAEDGLSPDTALRMGGSRATGLLGKMDRAIEGGAATGDAMSVAYLASALRLEDIAAGRNPLASDRSVRGDADFAEATEDPSDWAWYLGRTGQRPMSVADSDGNPANDEAVLFAVAREFAADYADLGTIQANRLNLSHLLGCVRAGVVKFGDAPYRKLVEDKYPSFAKALKGLVESALNKGTAAGMSQNVVDMLTMLRTDTRDITETDPETGEEVKVGEHNEVSLVLRASADAAKVLRAGYNELAARKDVVCSHGGTTFTGAELAACIQLSMCANEEFDPARDSNARGNVSAMFGSRVDEWERWGAAVTQNPVLRQLCMVPRGAAGYNLFARRSAYADLDLRLARRVAALSGMPDVTREDLDHPATQRLVTPFSVLHYIARAEYTSPHAIHRDTSVRDGRFAPGGPGRRRIVSAYMEGESHKLRPQTSIKGVRFRGPSGEFFTIEEAVNDFVSEKLAAFAADKKMAAWLADPRNETKAFSWDLTEFGRRARGMRTGRYGESTVAATPAGGHGAQARKRELLNYGLAIDEVLERAWTDYGSQFSEWAQSAAFDGGDALSRISSPLMRDKLEDFVRTHAATALDVPSIRSGVADPSFAATRLRRTGLFSFLEGKHPEDKDRFFANPEANIRAALERVFGDWSKETGCKVERVVGGNGVPSNLLRITRKVKVEENGQAETKEVVTYVSYGDFLAMKANNANYNQAILNAVNDGAGQKMTMEQLLSLTEEERVAMANAAGLRVKGTSAKAEKYLGTRALMALSGVIRLSDVSSYHTLFHEYFHQMLDFYRKTGVCTAEDEAALLKKYRTADGRFDEEAAADAFADYVTGDKARTVRGKLLAAGVGDPERTFEKFRRTAQAYLSCALAYDARGVPVFMKMMISADFSSRDAKEVLDFDAGQEKKLEKLLLGEKVDFGAPDRWERMEGEIGADGTDLAGLVAEFRAGACGFDEVKAAASKFVRDGRKPENRTTFDAVMGDMLGRKEEPPVPPAEEPSGPTLAQRISDPSVPVGDRVSLLFREALERVGSPAGGELAGIAEAVAKFRDKADVGEADGPDFELMAYTAHRLLGHVCDLLGLDVWDYAEDGTKSLNDLGRQLMSDEKIAGFVVRLVHEYSVRRKAENEYGTPEDVPSSPAQFASADYVMGNMLAGVLPSEWTKFCRGRAEASRDWFMKAAEDLEARAKAARARFPDGDVPADVESDAKRFELQAEACRHRARDVVRFVTAVMNGEPLKRMIPSFWGLSDRRGWTEEQAASNYFGYILQYMTGAATMHRNADGSVRYEPGKAFGFSNGTLDFSSRFVQDAIDAAAKALGVAQVVRRFVRENGMDQPAPGEDATIPTREAPTQEVPLAVPPAEGVLEPDLTPQLILQLPGSWQASDLQKQFYGGSFRDMMTDVSLNAATEETNRVANMIDFYLAANCMPGESPNQIEEGTSDLGFGEGGQEGLFTVEERHRHSVKKVAGVRGILLGLVNFAAKTAGRAMTKEDVNLVHFVSQTVACMANGHGVYTGYDIPYVDRRILKSVLEAAGEAEGDMASATAEGHAYSPDAVFNRLYGHVASAGRPSNLDQLLNRMLEGIPWSVLGWDAKRKAFRADGIYVQILNAFHDVGRTRTAGVSIGDADFHQRVTKILKEAGLADESPATHRVVLVVPASEVKRAWESEDSYRTELIRNGGRRAELLDMDYLAEVVAAEANRLNRIAGRSRWLSESDAGRALSGRAQGLWFEAGTGHHQAIVDKLKNARELFRGEISTDEYLRNKFAALQDTLKSHSKEVTHRYYVRNADGRMEQREEREILGNLRAFERGSDGQLANISNRQLMYLGRVLGLGRRVADVEGFLKQILAGQYTKANTSSIYGFDIRPDMTVFEFDRLVFDIITAHVVTEAQHPGDPGHTPLTMAYDEGGCGYGGQDLVDVYHLHGQLQQKIMDDQEADMAVRGRICSMSEQDMFRTQGRLGSSKSATERLRSMAESITHAERFRGCLAQMLTTVGTDGAPNFVVKPSEDSQGLFPDEFWQATARFVLDRLRSVEGMVKYDAGKSGFANMQTIATAAGALAKAKSKDDARARYHLLPPDEIGARGLFDEIWCADDSASDDVNILTKFASERIMRPNGSEAEGYLRQLFGSVQAPTVWAGHRVLDRAVSYSKAASVGLSAFFAFATRFESPVAACGFWNTAMGYRKNTAELARRLAGTKVGEFLGFRKNLPYLADFLNSITSDDPSIRYMRELCDMINMPLTDSVMNPLTNRQGAIDADIDRISRWLAAEGHTKMAKEVRSAMKAAFHNPGEYAFSNVLNGVKMAVVAQTMFRLREECEKAGRPFDPVRELRRHSAYINAEIGGIQPERYAFLTPGMQQLLRLGMFSYQWTLGAWVAGTGEVVTDLLFGGHHTTEASRKRAFIRWLRMLGIIKIGVPVFLQLGIKALATALVKSGAVGDPDDKDDKDPLGIDDMPWLCFFNESKVGSLAFDVTPITRLLGRTDGSAAWGTGAAGAAIGALAARGPWWMRLAGAAAGAAAGQGSTLVDIKNKRGAWPFVTTVLGTVAGAAVTRKWWGTLAGGFAGRNIGALIPASEGVGRDANTTGLRRQYMHFGKQNDEFWRWFTDGWSQAMSKTSIPLQKTIEGIWGTVSGQSFGKKFEDLTLAERVFTMRLDPDVNALTNFLTGFLPFSAASVAGHPDTGFLGMMGPVNQGTSKTRSQKEIKKILLDFVRDSRHNDAWSFPSNKAKLARLCTLVMKEARMNGLDPDEILSSALGQVTSQEYIRLFDALPRTARDTVNARAAKAALRSLYRLNRKRSDILQSIKKKYKDANVDWSQQKNAKVRAAVKDFLGKTREDPWLSDELTEDLFERHFADETYRPLRSVDVQQDRKGGEAFSNFLATDDVPDVLFGIPVVSSGHTEEDLEFFRRNPKAAGFYDLGDEEPPPEEPPPEEPPVQAANKGGDSPKKAKYLRAIDNMRKLKIANETDRAAGIRAVAEAHKALHPRDDLFATYPGTGQYKHPDDVALLSHVLADPKSAASVDDMMAYFYGDDADKIQKSVVAKRLAAGGRDKSGKTGRNVSNVFGTFKKGSAGNYVFDMMNPLKQVFTERDPVVRGSDADSVIARARGRKKDRAAHWTSGVTYLPSSQLDAAFHEVLGHGFNLIQRQTGQPIDPQEEKIPGSEDTWSKRGLYYAANDAEMAAELGNLRKTMYKHFATDIGTPAGFNAMYDDFVANPGKYDTPIISGRSRELLNAIRYFREYEPERHPEDSQATRDAILERKRQIEEVLSDESLLGQVADAGTGDARAARAGQSAGTAAPSLPAKARKAPGGSARSKGDR